MLGKIEEGEERSEDKGWLWRHLCNRHVLGQTWEMS